MICNLKKCLFHFLLLQLIWNDAWWVFKACFISREEKNKQKKDFSLLIAVVTCSFSSWAWSRADMCSSLSLRAAAAFSFSLTSKGAVRSTKLLTVDNCNNNNNNNNQLRRKSREWPQVMDPATQLPRRMCLLVQRIKKKATWPIQLVKKRHKKHLLFLLLARCQAVNREAHPSPGEGIPPTQEINKMADLWKHNSSLQGLCSPIGH